MDVLPLIRALARLFDEGRRATAALVLAGWAEDDDTLPADLADTGARWA
jgi:hypothetical protein